MRRVVYLKKEKEQRTCARLYSSFDQGGADTESGDKWGMSISHPTDLISKYIRDAVTSSGTKDWKWISNLVKEWANWTLVVFGGYVMMVILAVLQCGVRDYIIGNASATNDDGKVKVFTGGSEDDHINSPIMSSGESKESITLYAEHLHNVEEDLILSGDTQTCGALLCDSTLDCNTASDGIMELEYIIDDDNNVCASYGDRISYYGYRGYNVMSIDNDGKAWNRGECNYGEKDDSHIMTHRVDIKLDDVSGRKFGGIASMISMEIRSIGKRRGYREGTNGE